MSQKTKNIPKLRFPEFVNSGEWEEKKLSEVIDFKSGYAFSSSRMSNEVQQYQLIKMSNVYQNILDLDRNPSYWEKINQIESEFLLETGDVVLTLTGTVGKKDYGYSVMIEENNKFLLNQRLVRLRAINERSVSKFIRNLVLHENFLDSFFINSRGGTGNQSNVSIEDLKQIKLPIPERQEQQTIADFLSSVDEQITQNIKKVELLKEHKKGLLQQLFPQEGESVPRLRFPEFVDSGEWEEKRLGEIVKKMQSGGTPKADNQEFYNGNIPFVKVNDITSSGKYLTKTESSITEKGLKNSSAWIVPINSIMYSMYASVGFLSINKIEVATSQAMINIILDVEKANLEYIYYCLLDFKKNVHTYVETGTQGNLNAQTVRNLIIKLPSLPEQQKIADCLSSVDSLITSSTKKVELLKEHKKGLMQQLFPSSEE